MKKIQISARFKIHKGKSKEFTQLAKDCLVAVKEKDKGALQYDWFFSEDASECVVRETYGDSDAVLAHLGVVGELLGKMAQLSDLSVEVYGNMSETLKKATTGMPLASYSYFQGL